MGDLELLMNQAQSITQLSLANLAFNGIPLPLVINELLLPGNQQFKIGLGPSQK
jgi:hypothetical protein